jgi:hypothetical protein
MYPAFFDTPRKKTALGRKAIEFAKRTNQKVEQECESTTANTTNRYQEEEREKTPFCDQREHNGVSRKVE